MSTAEAISTSNVRELVETAVREIRDHNRSIKPEDGKKKIDVVYRNDHLNELTQFLNSPNSRGNDNYISSSAGMDFGGLYSQLKILDGVAQSTGSEVPGHTELRQACSAIIERLVEAFRNVGDDEALEKRMKVMARFAGHETLSASKTILKSTSLTGEEKEDIVPALAPYLPDNSDPLVRRDESPSPGFERLFVTGNEIPLPIVDGKRARS